MTSKDKACQNQLEKRITLACHCVFETFPEAQASRKIRNGESAENFTLKM